MTRNVNLILFCSSFIKDQKLNTRAEIQAAEPMLYFMSNLYKLYFDIFFYRSFKSNDGKSYFRYRIARERYLNISNIRACSNKFGIVSREFELKICLGIE